MAHQDPQVTETQVAGRERTRHARRRRTGPRAARPGQRLRHHVLGRLRPHRRLARARARTAGPPNPGPAGSRTGHPRHPVSAPPRPTTLAEGPMYHVTTGDLPGSDTFPQVRGRQARARPRSRSSSSTTTPETAPAAPPPLRRDLHHHRRPRPGPGRRPDRGGRPGDIVIGPPGVPHSFTNAGRQGPAGLHRCRPRHAGRVPRISPNQQPHVTSSPQSAASPGRELNGDSNADHRLLP